MSYVAKICSGAGNFKHFTFKANEVWPKLVKKK